MENRIYSCASLLPLDPEINKKYISHTMKNIIFLNWIFVLINGFYVLYFLAFFLVGLCMSKYMKMFLIPIVFSICKTAYFLILRFIGSKFPKVEFFFTFLSPLVMTAAIVEEFSMSLSREIVIMSILVVIPFILLYPMLLPMQFPLSISIPVICSLYPAFRMPEISIAEVYCLVYSAIGVIFCGYQIRKAYTSSVCQLMISQNTQEKWKNMMQNLPTGIAILSQNPMQCDFSNPSLIKLLHLIENQPPEESFSESSESNRSISPLLNPHDVLSRLRIKLVSDLDEQNTEYFNFENFLSYNSNNSQGHFFVDYDTRLIEVTINDITYDNREEKLVSFTDCSAVQKIEKLQSENKYKTLLFSTISHELRTPINAVMNSIELMKPFVPPDKQQLVRISEDSCNLILYHVNDFMDYGKLSQQNIVLNLKQVNIRKLVKFCIELIRFPAEQKGLNLQLEAKKNIPKFLNVDERRLKQIIINILNNAVKFTFNGYTVNFVVILM